MQSSTERNWPARLMWANPRHGKAWKLINDISDRNYAQSSKLEAKSPVEQIKLCNTHFSNPLGSPPQISEEDTPVLTVFDALDITEEPFSNEEFLQAKNAIWCRKACGVDGITPEFLNNNGLDNIVLGFVNQGFMTCHIPERWKMIIIVIVPKSGDLSNPNNYSGISIISLVMKLYSRMIIKRLRPT